MARTRHRSEKKVSGGRYRPFRTKKKCELAGFAANTKLGEFKARKIRVIGGSFKHPLLQANKVSVSDKKGRTTIADIVNVVENPANPNLVRRNIITKGAVVETNLGKVRITSRPGQEGTISGVLI